MKKELALAATAIAGLMQCTIPALSHHSEAMFDPDKVLTLTGTVTEFQYVSPHSWLYVLVSDDKGVETLWAFETTSPSALMRAGIKRNSLMPGDVITMQARPLRDGRPAGQWLAVTKSDGTTLKLRPSAPPVVPAN